MNQYQRKRELNQITVSSNPNINKSSLNANTRAGFNPSPIRGLDSPTRSRGIKNIETVKSV